jgi:Autophagy protein Apg5
MAEQSRGGTTVTALIAQQMCWEGRILIQLTLAPTSVSSPTIPPPIYVLVPRNTYLHVGLQLAVERLYPFAPISPNFTARGGLVLHINEPDPGVNSDGAEIGKSENRAESRGMSSPSNDNQRTKKFVYPVCWFEDEETRMALRWQYFVGLLFDMKSSSNCSIPWKIKLHFNNYPSSQILPLESPNLLTHVQASFKHSLKQAMTVATRNSKSAMNVTKESHGILWDAVSTGNCSLYQRVELISTQKQPLQAIPIRVLVNATSPPIQRRIDGVKISMSLGHILQELLPEYFVISKGTDSTSGDTETTNVQLNPNTVRFWRVCGVQPPLSTNILDLWKCCSHPDQFLYIIVLTR